MIDIITVRGAGEAHDRPLNMLGNVVELLDKKRFRHVADLDYPASIGPVNPQRNPFGPNLSQSLTIGKHALADAIRATPNLVGVLGYSLGAYVVSDFLEDVFVAAPYTHDCKVMFTGLVANPRRAPGNGLPGYGIAGAHHPWPAIRSYEAAHPGDGIPCCPERSPLRSVADWLIARQRPPQPAPTFTDWIRDPLGTRAAYGEAGRYIAGYLGIEHTGRYLIDGHIRRLADTINREVR